MATPKKKPTTTTRTTGRTKRTSGSTSTPKPLVIVESPNKVRTIAAILGDDFVVRASYGHVADIPERDDAVDIANGFAVRYRPTKKGAEVLSGLAADLAGASELILATDDDREGEMIAHLLVETLAPNVPVSRIVFHAITRDEVLGSLAERRQIDPLLVEAARTRRVLDHLYGFQVSPVLWSKVRPNLSAGRVQSPALMLLARREEERRAFRPTLFCGVEAHLAGGSGASAVLASVDGVPVATSRDIDADGVVSAPARLLEPVEASVLAGELAAAGFTVSDARTERYTRRPRPPYTTSDLLSDIVNRLHVGAARAQMLMNQLHEAGHISYPRTDSPSLSPQITWAARRAAEEMFGGDSVPDKPNFFRSPRKSAQGAHEAIRPGNLSVRAIKGMTPQHRAVYDMVWRRTVASQMRDATGTTHSVTIAVETAAGVRCAFTASGTIIENPGHRLLFTSPDDEAPPTPLAALAAGDAVAIGGIEVKERTTRPPARYTVASLIKALEELEIGRPSTYASAIEALRREYVWSRRGDRSLIPTVTGMAVAQFLAARFPLLVDVTFTRQMEERLEAIVEGEGSYQSLLSVFFSEGDGRWPALAEVIGAAERDHDPREHPVLVLGAHPVTGEEITLRAGRSFTTRRAGAKRGSGRPYLKCGTRNVPVNDHSEFPSLDLDWALSLLDVPREGRTLGEIDGRTVALKTGPYGPYVTDGQVSASVPESTDLASVGLETAESLISERRARLGKRGGRE